MVRVYLLVAAAWMCLVAPQMAQAQARRVVDVVTVGDVRSERAHDYEGDRVTDGIADGRRFRHALGWQRYTLTIYDDTEVTVVCTFRGTDGETRTYEFLVDGQTLPTRPLVSASSMPVSVEVRVPLNITRGRTSISVTIRSAKGPTPGLMELRSVQEHLELW